ncbi:VOC family protein [Sulfitobacter geojensis]|uniref:VOC family protein n=1 Tax=Sulfitobacter geojensis TaxID=1342299 RepID=UPI0036D9651F
MSKHKKIALALDHIAVAAASLEEGIAYVQSALGVQVPPGGSHPTMGTHNHLMALGPNLFLEVIAVDRNAPKPERPRWFALDHFSGAPKVGTWVLSSDDIAATLSMFPSFVGPAIPITRGNLSWLISVPEDGSMPMDGTFPTLIEWPNGSPAGMMDDLGCRLRKLNVYHPDAADINDALSGMFTDDRVLILPDANSKIIAEIETPNGIRILS